MPKSARMHEIYGASADGFVLALAGRLAGSVVWVRQNWAEGDLNPLGLSDFCDPSQILLSLVANQTDGLAIAEEALREKSVSLVVIEILQPIDLTAGRRLQLAAKAGKTTGVALIQEGMGSLSTETRWRCSPVFDAKDSTLQHWELIKNKSGTLGSWHVRWDRTARSMFVVSPPGERTDFAPPAHQRPLRADKKTQ
ncbi:MAG: hypothetical protein AAF429_07910 [Pseudomonadota bacterium]